MTVVALDLSPIVCLAITTPAATLRNDLIILGIESTITLIVFIFLLVQLQEGSLTKPII